MKRYHIFVILIFSTLLCVGSFLNNKIPEGWNINSDVAYSNETFTIVSNDINYTYQEIEGDKTITVKLVNVTGKAGIELRESNDNTKKSSLLIDNKDSIWLRIVRKGNIVSQYTSNDGKAWNLVDETNISKLNSKIHLGMVVMSKDSKTNSKAKFNNVSISNSDKIENKCTEVIGNIRVQIISPTLVRIEEKGPKGFEDRKTFHIEERDWVGASYKKEVKGDYIHISTDDFVVKVHKKGLSINNVSIVKKDGSSLWDYLSESNSKWLPEPSDKIEAWSIIDEPRIIPSEWGFVPAEQEIAKNGWDLDNKATDVYVFIPKGDYKTLRSDFIKLTGRTDMIPLFALGSWDSRFYAYTDKSALRQIDDYRKRDIPLDVLVIDTDWRIGGSDGYTINTKYFPDIESFFKQAHDKNIKVMFNDHPGSVSDALTREELTFRSEGLSLLLNKGLDIWWYDRNWHTGIQPVNGISKETWGMEIYRNITDYLNGNLRPLIMANFDGIDNGILSRAPNIAAHRYPIQWTGDTFSTYLQKGIENMVYVGVAAPFPYLSEDLGGHFDTPSSESYVRWIQYGALSPVYRVHCSSGLERMPWKFGKEAETIARDYLNMRYRLLPLFYTASRNNYDTGEPILRRCDLDYPEFEEAKRNDQYLLGNGILIAPIYEGYDNATIPKTWFSTSDGKEGLTGEYYNNTKLSGEPVLTRTDSQINFDWGMDSPASSVNKNNFTIRWSGTITIKGNDDVKLVLTSDDGVKLWINDELILNKWEPQNSVEHITDFVLKKGETYNIKIEYLEIGENAKCIMYARPYTEGGSKRELWLPPGKWINAWTGEIIDGNKVITTIVPLDKTPMFIKQGTIVTLAPEMQYTSEKPHDPITLDIYPSINNTITEELYEDDTKTIAYKKGEYRKTTFITNADDNSKTITVKIDKAIGDFEGSLQNRSWVVRLRKPTEWDNLNISTVTVNGSVSEFKVIKKDIDAMPFSNEGGSPDSDVIEIKVTSKSVYEERNIIIKFI